MAPHKHNSKQTRAAADARQEFRCVAATTVYLVGMRNVLLVAAVSLAAISGCSKSDKTETSAANAKPEEALLTMTVDEVDRALAAKEAQPVDCNSDQTRKKMGIVPGATLVTDDESYAASELPPDKSTKLVFYCADVG
ncbi:MAG: Rhodanese protein [Myxococcales bacterium]|nr:Rhodanese protein [Myxococcales bacterium]